MNQYQFEKLIRECVEDALYERRSSRRNTLNESQLNSYIRQMVNEELTNEGFWDYLRGSAKKVGGDMSNAVQNAYDTVANGAQNAYNSAKGAVQNAYDTVANGAQNAYNSAKGYANDVMQSGKNASAAADTQKLVQQVDNLYQKYGQQFTRNQKSSIRSAKSALTQLAQGFNNGTVNA